MNKFAKFAGTTPTKQNFSSGSSSFLGGISVNLLPQEIILKRKQGSRLLLINRLSIFTLAVLIFFTSATLALRLSQNFELQKAQKNLAYAESKVSQLKDREEQVIVLKQRLGTIQNILGGDAKRKAIFNLVVFLTPPEIQIYDVSVDRNGSMNLSLDSSSLSAIDTLVSNLGNKEKNSDLIAKVNLEGMAMGRDQTYRFTLKVIPKNEGQAFLPTSN